ncbi:MAG: TIM44-like domain-containing protein [Sutterella sp.]|nr:TIM44-like domain-containing protein [Sutterella sp.]
MKKILAIFCVCLALATTSLDAEAAKRIGGGGSFGRPAPTFSQKAPAPAAAPKAPQQNAASQQRQQQTAPAPKPAQKPSMMRSILTGMAAALGISALLSLLGVDSAGLASLLTGVLIALALFFVVRMALGAMAQKRVGTQASTAAQTVRMPPEPQNAEPAAYASQSGARAGSVMDQFSGSSVDLQNDGTAEDVTPVDFDRDGFLKVALENYGKLQKAWDTGNVIEISDFTTQDVFVAITHQLRQRGHEVYQSDILELKNDLLGIAREGNVYLAAVEFRGRIRIGDETEVVNEIWTLEKPVEGSGGWLLAGIKQNESED